MLGCNTKNQRIGQAIALPSIYPTSLILTLTLSFCSPVDFLSWRLWRKCADPPSLSLAPTNTPTNNRHNTDSYHVLSSWLTCRPIRSGTGHSLSSSCIIWKYDTKMNMTPHTILLEQLKFSCHLKCTIINSTVLPQTSFHYIMYGDHLPNHHT